MNLHLVVVRPFAGFAKGEVVTEETRIAEILRSEQAANVVRVLTPSQRGN